MQPFHKMIGSEDLEDYGCGFDPHQARHKNHHMGL